MEHETVKNRLESLLHSIAKLYAGIVATIVHERVTTYRADTDLDDDIGKVLRTYIKQVKQRASVNPTGAVDPALPTEKSPEQNTSSVENPRDEAFPNPLSDHFKKVNAYSELATPLGEKLKTSAWDHTHSAIRLAHQGDFASAKLHAELANNAIHELSHFMSEAEFLAFKRAVKDELLNKG